MENRSINSVDELIYAIVDNQKCLDELLDLSTTTPSMKPILFHLFDKIKKASGSGSSQFGFNLTTRSLDLLTLFVKIYHDRLAEKMDGKTILHHILSEMSEESINKIDIEKIRIIKSIIEEVTRYSEFDINSQDSKGDTVLHYVMKLFNGLPEIVSAVCNVPGLDPNIKNNDGNTALFSLYYDIKTDKDKINYISAHRDKDGCASSNISMILDNFASVPKFDPNICDSRGRSLYIFTYLIGFNENIIKKLDKIGANPHIRDSNGCNILGWFYWYSMRTVKYFIEELKVECSDKQFEGCIWSAKTINLLEYIIKRQEITDYVGILDNAKDIRAVECIMESGKLSDTQIHNYLRQLCVPNYILKPRDTMGIAKYVISKINNINSVIYDGGLAILHVCDDIDILKYIKDNTNIDPHCMTDDQKNTLHYFNINGKLCGRELDTTKFLIEKMGVDPTARDIDGNTLLHFQQCHGAYEYLRKYIDINATNKYGRTCLHCSVLRNNLIIEEGRDFNMRDNNGMTPLHYAIMSPSMIDTLANNGVDPNILDKKGKAPLHYAIKHACSPYVTDPSNVIAMLKIKGINPSIEDSNGATPIDYAMRYGNDIFNTGKKIKRLILEAISNKLTDRIKGENKSAGSKLETDHVILGL